MNLTLKERIKKKLIRIGRKNSVCRILIFPVLACILFFFNLIEYIRGNVKRFAMLAISFLLFVVYSSFSFPMFVSGDSRTVAWSLTDVGSDIELAQENVLSPEDMEMIAAEEMREEDYDSSYESDGAYKYDASEILDLLEDRVDSKDDANNMPQENGEVVFDKNDWKLILINKQHSIPDDYEFTLGTITDNLKCDERIISDLRDMLKAAQNDGINLEVRSPYRTPEHQEWLFDRKIKKYMELGMTYMEAYQLAGQASALPGNSEHEVGLALDIVCDKYSDLKEGFADTDAGKWLAENSCKFGFILRYPKGKEYVTGIEFEPWHFRYVGVDAAMVITERDITLEEFREEL